MGKHYTQLELDERIELCWHHDAGTAPSEIARIGRTGRPNRLQVRHFMDCRCVRYA